MNTMQDGTFQNQTSQRDTLLSITVMLKSEDKCYMLYAASDLAQSTIWF